MHRSKATVHESEVAGPESVPVEHQPVKLDGDEFSRLVEALDKAPIPVPALVDLFSKRSRIPPP